MQYSIGEVAELAGISVSTLRYYDREGLFPNLERSNGGIRRFTENEVEALKIVECLKASGLSIKEIKQFLDWCQEGDSSLQMRRALFYERLAVVKEQMEALQKTMDTIRFKCWYYDTALYAGMEAAAKSLLPKEMPEEIRIHQYPGCLTPDTVHP
ncbi:MAG: MerR family transcriptional regulator [Christensenellales bacterium]|jgi:DNA-binding transcriptional MerR regulator